MKTNRLKLFIRITGILFFVDWILGVLQASGIIPTWTFLIANFPVGLLFVWMEYSWTGSHYLIFGHRIGDMGSLIVFISVVLCQAYLYYRLLILWFAKRHTHPTVT